MKWIILAIILGIVPYTVLTLRYRKEAPAFQPYEDMKNRANVARLLAAGFQRIPIAATRPADGAKVPGGAAGFPAPGGLPAELKSTLVEPLLLPSEINSVSAAPVAEARQPYPVQLTCTLPDDKQQLGGAHVYVRGGQLVIAPTFEPIPANLLTRSRGAAVLLTIPAGALKPGHYQTTLVGERASRTWTIEVR
jgi:hypothetical protein